MKQGQETNWCTRGEDGTSSAGARILYSVLRRAKAQRNPLCSLARTAIEVPGFGNHSHQLGSNPL